MGNRTDSSSEVTDGTRRSDSSPTSWPHKPQTPKNFKVFQSCPVILKMVLYKCVVVKLLLSIYPSNLCHCPKHISSQRDRWKEGRLFVFISEGTRQPLDNNDYRMPLYGWPINLLAELNAARWICHAYISFVWRELLWAGLHEGHHDQGLSVLVLTWVC